MKEKATKKSSKTAFQKILNYLLFQDFNAPDFSSGYIKLSESFIESNKTGASTDEALNSKLIGILKIQLLNLDYEDRGEIIDTILDDKNSYDVLLFFFAMEIEKQFKNKPDDIQAEFLKILLYYQSDNQLNTFILIYFKLYFIDLYESKFSKLSQISEQEYKSILKIYTTKKLPLK
ncbi:hypothetical protein ACSLMH_01755 [Flavobacterium columnare]|uniref:hypothetical protein n=1 Tax=Flavobacterium columnare TaxID=996 RepID=UPI0040341342